MGRCWRHLGVKKSNRNQMKQKRSNRVEVKKRVTSLQRRLRCAMNCCLQEQNKLGCQLFVLVENIVLCLGRELLAQNLAPKLTLGEQGISTLDSLIKNQPQDPSE